MLRREPLGAGVEIFVNDHHGFGTDAVLLADFCEIKNKDLAADFGTGCGIIPFLWSRFCAAEIFGVEIAKEAVNMAHLSNELNGKQGQITFVNADIRKLPDCLPKGQFTLISCNPPYKPMGAGLRGGSDARQAARHELNGGLADFIGAASRLLQTGGRFCLCSRPERLAETIVLASSVGLEPKRLRTVAKCAGNAPWLFLLECRKNGKSGLRVLPELYVHNPDGSVSDEMESIYGCYREGAGS